MHPLEPTDALCFWDFGEEAGQPRVSLGTHNYALLEGDNHVEQVSDDRAPFGPFASRFAPGHWLYIPRKECPALNIRGVHAQLSLVAWLKREHLSTPADAPKVWRGCEAIAGMWNEHRQRQYCLFLHLQIWDSAQQVGAHISSHGAATPGYKYCMDAAIGQTPVDFEQWHCVAISYDGQYARAYLDGKLDERPGRNPFFYPAGIFDGGGLAGADFTVGAVARPQTVDDNFQPHGNVIANNFIGLLGGLAVYDRALSHNEMLQLAQVRS